MRRQEVNIELKSVYFIYKSLKLRCAYLHPKYMTFSRKRYTIFFLYVTPHLYIYDIDITLTSVAG